jgi:hypothetical protein
MKNSINSFVDGVVAKIIILTNQFFGLFDELVQWHAKKQQLELQHPEFKDVPNGKKTGWYFLLFGLVPLSTLIDYSSIASFISYLAASTGNSIASTIISLFGFAVFIILELAVGWLILFSNKPLLKIMGYVLATILIIVPAFLIYTTYQLTEVKTEALYYKSIALMTFSILIHCMLFLLIKEIWAGITYMTYRRKSAAIDRKNPINIMKNVRTEIQSLYIHFDTQTAGIASEQRTSLLPPRAWYLKEKLTNGISTDDFDLSNYNPTGSYLPAPSSSNPIGFQITKN